MKGVASILVFSIYLHAVLSEPCPEKDSTLVRWSDHANTWNGVPPVANGNVTISKRILLDEQPPTIWNIVIEANGALVWDPSVYVHLKVHWIRVDGEMHIGSKDCPFTAKTRITFLGNVKENDLGAGGDKSLFVTAGGTLEIHGAPKLSWTKLTKTAEKMDTTNGVFVQQRDIPGVRAFKGLFAYSIDAATGELANQAFFNFNINKRRLPQVVENFVNFLKGIPVGNIAGVSLKRVLAPKGDIEAALQAIEQIAGQGQGQNPLRSFNGGAYALITKIGSPELTTEVYTPWLTNGKPSVAKAVSIFGNLYVSLKCLSNSNNRGMQNFVNLFVADDLAYRPIITLLEDASSWKGGDKIIIASTDYDWKQAEEKTIMNCGDLCAPNQVRLWGPLKYTHYGETYKNVDMRGEVGLLSRNILFDSEDAEGSTTYGGNLKVLKDFKSVHIEGAEFNDLGQEEVLGRYPIHFHMCEDVDGDEATRPWIKHNSIHHSNSRCVTIHGTHGLIIEDNVCYLTRGHAYFLEDGGEKRTVLDGNLGLGQERGILIKADRIPTTFWITNPQSYVRNNAAGGGTGRGYWYTYPRLPLAPSDDKGFMVKDEARHTAVYEFDNNVAHSYRNHGIFVDNEFLENTDARGYNRYRPKEDPLMHLKYKNSTDKAAIFNRLTAYKNSPRNAWFRGGLIKVTHASLSDSPHSINIIKENSAVQHFESSVVIGDSPNVGEVSRIDGMPVSIGRSFPRISRTSSFFLWRSGLTFQKGPVHVKDVYFDDFADNEYYHMGAIGFRHLENHSPRNNIVNARFGFSDPDEGNRVQVPVVEDDAEQSEDDIRSFRDIDHSVTGVTGEKPVTLVVPEPFHMTDSCSQRANWNFAYCRHNYAEINTRVGDKDNVLTVTRDDNYQVARIDVDQDRSSPFLTIIGEEYSYSMFWESMIPETIFIRTMAVTKSEGVRLGMCIPPAAEFKIAGRYPTRIGVRSWTSVGSVGEVDAAGEYFYDSDTGYLAVYLTHESDYAPDEANECPGAFCSFISVFLKSGDRSGNDCLDAVHDKFDLSPGVSVARRSVTNVMNLLSGRLHRQKRSTEDTTVLPSMSLPQNWGAGETRTVVA